MLILYLFFGKSEVFLRVGEYLPEPHDSIGSFHSVFFESIEDVSTKRICN